MRPRPASVARCHRFATGVSAFIVAKRTACSYAGLSGTMRDAGAVRTVTVYKPGTRPGLAPRHGVTYLRNDAMRPSWRPTEGSFNADT